MRRHAPFSRIALGFDGYYALIGINEFDSPNLGPHLRVTFQSFSIDIGRPFIAWLTRQRFRLLLQVLAGSVPDRCNFPIGLSMARYSLNVMPVERSLDDGSNEYTNLYVLQTKTLSGQVVEHVS